MNVSLDYETGKFLSRIKNSDLVHPSQYTGFQDDNVASEHEYILTGTFPIEEIKDQHQINQNYEVELQLENDELNLPAFEGFNNEIELWLIFSGYVNVR